MEPEHDGPYGPYPVQTTGTVTVPKDLLVTLGLGAGDRVHWFVNPTVPGTLVLVPSKTIAGVFADLVLRPEGAAPGAP